MQRELEGGAREQRSERDRLRVDVQPCAHQADLQHGVEDEADHQHEPAQAEQRMPADKRFRSTLGLQLAQNPDRREVRPEVERDVSEHDEGFDRRRHHDQGPGLRPVHQRRVVDRVRRPVHDRVLPHDQRRHQDHHQHRAAGISAPANDEDDGQNHDHDQRADLRDDLPVIESRQEPDWPGPSFDVRIRHARIDGRTPHSEEEPEEAKPREQGDDTAPIRAFACRSR